MNASLSTTYLNRLLAEITYKPGWTFELYDGAWEGQHLVIRTVVPDATDPSRTTTLDVHSMLPPMQTRDHFFRWLMWRLARIEVHEMREFFKFQGEVVDDPHGKYADRDI